MHELNHQYFCLELLIHTRFWPNSSEQRAKNQFYCTSDEDLSVSKTLWTILRVERFPSLTVRAEFLRYCLLLCQQFLSQPFHCQDNSPYCLSYNSCDVSSESLVLHLLIILKLIFFFILVTCLLDIVLTLWGEIMSWSFMVGKGCCNSG